MIYDRLSIPISIRQGIKKLIKGKNQRMKIIGVDSETCQGEPFTFQFFSEDLEINEIVWTSKKTATNDFFDFCDKLKQNDSTYIMFGHNLSFDLVSFMYDRKDELLNTDVNFSHGKWNISGIYTDLCFLILTHKSRHKVIYIIDTFAFFKASLAKLAELFCPNLPKLKSPNGLGEKIFNKNDEKFCAYAIRDSEIAFRVGQHIVEYFDRYDIGVCFSVAHLASKIFRKKYMQKSIPLQMTKIIYASLNSYHGGKNNITVPMGEYNNIVCLDIVSAYPYIMTDLPSFYESKLYKGLHITGNPDSVPRHGIYKIEGHVKKCKYPIIYNHAFYPLSGDIKNVWITGYELNEAIKSKEFLPRNIYGYYYDSEKDTNDSPFKNYVMEFYALKDNAVDKVQRYFAKTLMNSLYGKFIQSHKHFLCSDYIYDIDNDKLSRDIHITAGGLFNPFIASLITGGTRALIHRYEHKYQAIHTATDGIICYKKNVKGFKENTKLGGLKLENEGNALILRNKLYLIFDYSGKIIKYATHGFYGTPEQLLDMYRKGEHEYEFQKVNKLKESKRRGLQVNKFEKRKATLKGVF